MLFVDQILRLLGEDPVAIYDDDKLSVILVHIINVDHFFMPILLGAPPLIWLYLRKKHNKPISKRMLIITIVMAIILGIIGVFILDWIMEIGFGLSYQRMYGDLFN